MAALSERQQLNLDEISSSASGRRINLPCGRRSGNGRPSGTSVWLDHFLCFRLFDLEKERKPVGCIRGLRNRGVSNLPIIRPLRLNAEFGTDGSEPMSTFAETDWA